MKQKWTPPIDPRVMKKALDLAILLLTALASFLGGNAAAQTGLVDLFPH